MGKRERWRMTTAEDIIRVIQERPDAREQVRRAILTDELLGLPEKFGRFVETTDRRFKALEAVLRQFMETTDRRFEALDDDVGEIRGFHAREVFIRRAALTLPRRTRFDLKTRLSANDIAAILRDADTTGIDEDDMDSFEDADAFLLVTDSEGAERYVSVEVSYTVHTDDVIRAHRNAQLLARWTGLPAHSAVAGREPARCGVEAQPGHWHDLPADTLQDAAGALTAAPEGTLTEE